ncbi:Fe(3+)-citrate import system permease protein YfmE [Paenibacillus albidus]|uniref:Fe(3+)-citrate import system permease protein YfmE n=1 Tax=Paenibacillus albidus TaxID=2041023 RepID=A0A917FTF4_9BACL|nr:iron ABC transporter permease [Paenibacillus albidus]GGG03469.1 Fe(3+)-citrate import system permease protein YfmE [Paenibacillus albidus]
MSKWRSLAADRGKRLTGTVFFLLLGIILLFVLHIGLGKTVLTPEEVLRALFNQGAEEGFRHIVWNLRLPRALIAIAAGLMLGTAGAILQVVMRNPLVEPGLVGASSGAVLAAVLWISFATDTLVKAVPLTFVALIGGLGAVLLVNALNAGHSGNGTRLALIGVIVTAILQSAVSLFLLQGQQGLSTIFLWTFGSLNGRGWSSWAVLWPWTVLGLFLSMVYARKAELLQLGDHTATGLGLAVNRSRFMLLIIASVLTAASVSVVGAIGFIGLIGPHIASLLVGRKPLFLFPVSALFSALLLLVSDWIGQSVTLRLPLPGMENHLTGLPVGAVTTLLGAPFFLFLLRRSLVKK